MPVALYALAMGGFCIGLTEFVIMGLLPEVADSLKVSEATAGFLITGYALSVAIGAIVLTILLNKANPKKSLLLLMSLFIFGNLLSALAGNYQILLLGRIVAALCHGAFFGISSVIATGLVVAEKKTQAIAIMFTGLTIANVLGVPLGTFIGQTFGWRATFWVITVLGIVAFVGIIFLIPNHLENSDTKKADHSMLADLVIFRRKQIWLSILITIFSFGGIFGAFTYIAYTLTKTTHFPESAVPWLLILFGVGLFIGNILGGRYADRNLSKTLIVILIGLFIVLTVFYLTADNKLITIISVFLMGAFGFATVPGLQMRIMNYAEGALTLASGANIAAFNIGNALGAFIGGQTLDAGYSYAAPILAGAIITAIGLAFLIYSSMFATGGELTKNSAQ